MSKRSTCPICLRPDKTCLCKFRQIVSNKIPLIILQHPDEMTHAKNTGRLLHLCLMNSQLIVGEVFDKNDVTANTQENTEQKYFDFLLYPDTTDYHSLGINPPPKFDWQSIKLDDFLSNRSPRLWVIDATWRKSRKMLYLNEFLQSMPLLALADQHKSNYLIRQAANKNHLSTFEATCYALQQLEAHSVNYEPAFAAFTRFIQEQAGYFGYES